MSGGSGLGQLLVLCVVNFSLNTSSKILCHLLYSESTRGNLCILYLPVYVPLAVQDCVTGIYVLCRMHVFRDDPESHLADKG